MPFTIRALEDEKLGRMGVVECVNHNLLQAYVARACSQLWECRRECR